MEFVLGIIDASTVPDSIVEKLEDLEKPCESREKPVFSLACTTLWYMGHKLIINPFKGHWVLEEEAPPYPPPDSAQEALRMPGRAGNTFFKSTKCRSYAT